MNYLANLKAKIPEKGKILQVDIRRNTHGCYAIG
jgi:hypothetical protein